MSRKSNRTGAKQIRNGTNPLREGPPRDAARRRPHALVLSGGGAKGAFQVGVLQALIEEQHQDFDVLCGVSVGALSAAFLAQAKHVPGDPAQSAANLAAQSARLRDLWLKEIRGNSSIYDKRTGGEAGILLGSDSIYDPAGLRRLLSRHLDPQQVSGSGRILKIGMVSLETGRYETVVARRDNERTLRDRVLASATMPFYFPPVAMDGDWWADGGLRNITPLAEAFAEKPARIVAVFTSRLGAGTRPEEIGQGFLGMGTNAFTFLGRTVQILVDEVYNNDVAGAEEWNEVLAAWQAIRGNVPTSAGKETLDRILGQKTLAELVLIAPTDDEVMAYDALDFTPARLRRAYEHGLEVARAVLAPQA